MLGGYYLGQLYLGISGLPSAGVLSVVPSSHQLSSDNITLTQKHTLVIDSSAHTLTSQNITLTQKHLLAVQDAVHALTSENTVLTSKQILAVANALHGLSSQNIVLTQKHTIVVNNTLHGHTVGNLDLVEHKTLTVANTLHGHTAESPAIVVHFYLVVQNALHGHTSSNLSLTQKQLLVVANTTHGLTSTVIAGLINIQPYGMGGGFGAVDGFAVAEFGAINIELPLNFLILAANNYHSLFDNFTAFTQKHNLVTQDSYLGIMSDALELTQRIFKYSGVYQKDFEDAGSVGGEYEKSTGTVPLKNGYFGQITPVADGDNGFFIVDMNNYGSYTQDNKTNGILSNRSLGSGTLTPDDIDTGNYIKIK